MTTMALTSPRGFDPLAVIDGAVHLAESTRKQYRKALGRYLSTGASLTDPNALTDYSQGLPSSSRAFLKASVKLLTERIANSVRGIATPENVDAVQAALFRLEALQEAIQVETPKGQKAHRWLSQAEVKTLMDTCGDDLRGQRDRLVLGLLVGAGLRRSEAVSLAFDDVKKQPTGDRVRTVLQVKGKGAKSRVVPISDQLAEMIHRWGERVGHQGRILRSIDRRGELRESLSPEAVYQLVGQRGWDAGLGDDLQPHDLRRTFCQLGHEAGIPLPQLSKLMGHSDVRTTQRYLNLDLDLEVTASDFVPVA